MRRPTKARTKQRTKTFAAPVRGWIESDNLALNNGGGAYVLENWFPLQATVRLRGGAFKFADIGSDPVLSLIPYQSGTTSKFFAASETEVFDITTGTAASAITSLTGGRWSYVQFRTSAGAFLVMVNGVDEARYFNGTAWANLNASSSPIAITGVLTTALSFIWMHGSRIWAVQKNTLSAWYLSVGQIGGAMTEFPMGSVFNAGGSLLFGAAWSMDSGDGMDDRCVFVTDQGEVAVYQGTDPSDAETWAKVGVYNIGKPVGVQTMQAGGDVLIATTDGIVALSQIVAKDPAALSLTAVSKPIEISWARAARTRDVTKPFPMLKWHREIMGIVGLPHRNETFVVNMQTGAWARWTGLDVQCLGLYGDLAYFGDASGNVFLMEGGGSDNGTPYVARMALQPDMMGAAVNKHADQARATFRALAPFSARLSASTDYRREFPPAPNAAADTSAAAVWDAGEWDVSRWDDGPDAEERQTVATYWRSLGVTGFAISPQVQVTCGSNRKPDAELVSIDMTYQVGGLVV